MYIGSAADQRQRLMHHINGIQLFSYNELLPNMVSKALNLLSWSL